MMACVRLLLLTVALGLPSVVAAQEPAAQAAPDFAPAVKRERALKVDVRAVVRANIHQSDAADAGDDEGAMDLARKRLGIRGSIRKLLAFEVEGELESESPWRDVFVDYRQFNAVRIRAGHFKVPFSLDKSTSASNIDFAFRSAAASYLAPGRDVGVMAHGRLLRRTVEYEAGFFKKRSARDDDFDRAESAQTLASRVLVRPFAATQSAASDLHVGVSITRGTLTEGLTTAAGRMALGASFFPRVYWVKGAQARTGLEARWRPGPFSFSAEHMRLREERLQQGIYGEDLAPITASGTAVSATWALTGGPKAEGLDKPEQPLFQGGIGAIELAGRFEHIRFGDGMKEPSTWLNPRDEHVAGNASQLVTVGVNWYPNRWVKIQANAIRETLDDSTLGPRPGQRAFWSRVLQLQLSL